MGEEFYSIDLPAIIIAALAGLCSSLTGCILLFQKRSMMADTLTHSILPGLALGYILTGTMSFFALMSGAFLTCLVAIIFVYIISKHSVLDNSAAMAIVLTSMFAIGVIMIEMFIDGRVHLDTQHALYGALELTYWPTPHTFETFPAQILVLGILSVIIVLLFFVFYKYYKIMLFDEHYSKTLGLPVQIMNAGLLIVTVAVCVASFDAVGSILVLALLICPPAAARMFTDNFTHYIVLSAFIGVACGISGYLIGGLLPLTLGFENSISAAGSIAVIAGLITFLSILFAPQYGYFSKTLEK